MRVRVGGHSHRHDPLGSHRSSQAEEALLVIPHLRQAEREELEALTLPWLGLELGLGIGLGLGLGLGSGLEPLALSQHRVGSEDLVGPLAAPRRDHGLQEALMLGRSEAGQCRLQQRELLARVQRRHGLLEGRTEHLAALVALGEALDDVHQGLS